MLPLKLSYNEQRDIMFILWAKTECTLYSPEDASSIWQQVFLCNANSTRLV